MDKQTQYELALARLNKNAFMRGFEVDSSDQLMLGEMAENNKAILEALDLAHRYISKDGFTRTTTTFNTYADVLQKSADVNSLFNRFLFIERAIEKALKSAQVLATADSLNDLKNLIEDDLEESKGKSESKSKSEPKGKGDSKSTSESKSTAGSEDTESTEADSSEDKKSSALEVLQDIINNRIFESIKDGYNKYFKDDVIDASSTPDFFEKLKIKLDSKKGKKTKIERDLHSLAMAYVGSLHSISIKAIDAINTLIALFHSKIENLAVEVNNELNEGIKPKSTSTETAESESTSTDSKSTETAESESTSTETAESESTETESVESEESSWESSDADRKLENIRGLVERTLKDKYYIPKDILARITGSLSNFKKVLKSIYDLKGGGDTATIKISRARSAEEQFIITVIPFILIAIYNTYLSDKNSYNKPLLRSLLAGKKFNNEEIDDDLLDKIHAESPYQKFSKDRNLVTDVNLAGKFAAIIDNDVVNRVIKESKAPAESKATESKATESKATESKATESKSPADSGALSLPAPKPKAPESAPKPAETESASKPKAPESLINDLLRSKSKTPSYSPKALPAPKPAETESAELSNMLTTSLAREKEKIKTVLTKEFKIPLKYVNFVFNDDEKYQKMVNHINKGELFNKFKIANLTPQEISRSLKPASLKLIILFLAGVYNTYFKDKSALDNSGKEILKSLLRGIFPEEGADIEGTFDKLSRRTPLNRLFRVVNMGEYGNSKCAILDQEKVQELLSGIGGESAPESKAPTETESKAPTETESKALTETESEVPTETGSESEAPTDLESRLKSLVESAEKNFNSDKEDVQLVMDIIDVAVTNPGTAKEQLEKLVELGDPYVPIFTKALYSEVGESDKVAMLLLVKALKELCGGNSDSEYKDDASITLAAYLIRPNLPADLRRHFMDAMLSIEGDDTDDQRLQQIYLLEKEEGRTEFLKEIEQVLLDRGYTLEQIRNTYGLLTTYTPYSPDGEASTDETESVPVEPETSPETAPASSSTNYSVDEDESSPAEEEPAPISLEDNKKYYKSLTGLFADKQKLQGLKDAVLKIFESSPKGIDTGIANTVKNLNLDFFKKFLININTKNPENLKLAKKEAEEDFSKRAPLLAEYIRVGVRNTYLDSASPKFNPSSQLVNWIVDQASQGTSLPVNTKDTEVRKELLKNYPWEKSKLIPNALLPYFDTSKYDGDPRRYFRDVFLDKNKTITDIFQRQADALNREEADTLIAENEQQIETLRDKVKKVFPAWEKNYKKEYPFNYVVLKEKHNINPETMAYLLIKKHFIINPRETSITSLSNLKEQTLQNQLTVAAEIYLDEPHSQYVHKAVVEQAKKYLSMPKNIKEMIEKIKQEFKIRYKTVTKSDDAIEIHLLNEIRLIDWAKIKGFEYRFLNFDLIQRSFISEVIKNFEDLEFSHKEFAKEYIKKDVPSPLPEFEIAFKHVSGRGDAEDRKKVREYNDHKNAFVKYSNTMRALFRRLYPEWEIKFKRDYPVQAEILKFKYKNRLSSEMLTDLWMSNAIDKEKTDPDIRNAPWNTKKYLPKDLNISSPIGGLTDEEFRKLEESSAWKKDLKNEFLGAMTACALSNCDTTPDHLDYLTKKVYKNKAMLPKIIEKAKEKAKEYIDRNNLNDKQLKESFTHTLNKIKYVDVYPDKGRYRSPVPNSNKRKIEFDITDALLLKLLHDLVGYVSRTPAKKK